MARTAGEPSSTRWQPDTRQTLDGVMRALGQAPPPLVLDQMPEDGVVATKLDLKKDLWMSTVDGRHQSPLIPIRVGPEVFTIHRDVLTKAEYFRKALDSGFREGKEQEIDLPEEDPAIFSFVVAYLYEEKFVPIKPVASALVSPSSNGKGKEKEVSPSRSDNGSESSAGMSDDRYDLTTGVLTLTSMSSNSERNIRRRENRRRREQRNQEERQQKDGNRHRPECGCAQCVLEPGPPCWNCGASRNPPPPPTAVIRPPRRYRHGGPPPPPPPPPYPRPGPAYMTYNPLHPNAEERPGSRNNDVPLEERMTAEDLRTWSLAYKLSVEVYVCADRYLMRDFKSCIAKYIINQFEVAGLLAAQPTVLECCKILHIGLSPLDPLLKKVLARVGFLQARLWKSFPEYTSHFFMENPELATVIMREMVERREEDEKDDLPAMERSIIRQLTHDERMQGRPRRNRIWLDD